MAAEAAAASTAQQGERCATLMNHATSSSCCCCFCRHGGFGLGIHGSTTEEAKARLAAALIAARSSDHTAAAAKYASLVLFAASVAVIFSKAGVFTGRKYERARGQMHSFHARRGFFHYQVGQDRKERYFVKKSRKSRWEWRPVTRRSTASQTSPSDSCSVGEGPSINQENASHIANPVDFPPPLDPIITDVPSLDDFPSLTRGIDDAPYVSQCQSSPMRTSEENEATEPSEAQQSLNRKQRKCLKKKQKKLFAASHTLQIGSLPILKSWKSSSSSSSCYNKLDTSAPTPCKIYDCSKTFGPLGSPSGKSIIWSFSPQPSTSLTSINPVPSEQTNQQPSEISESPKSYLGDWTDSDSFKRSQSDPEEIEMDMPSFDSEFDADSEDYSFQA